MLIASLQIAGQSLLAHPLRSAASSLGVVVAIATVIAVMTIGRGSGEMMRVEIERLGADVLTIEPGQSVRAGEGVRIAARPFEIADIDEIARQVRGIRHLAPIARQPVLAAVPGRSWTASAIGTTEAYFEARRWRLASGRMFTPYEIEIGKGACLIGDRVHRMLLGGRPAIGEMIRLKSMQCEVVGVLAPRRQSGAISDDDNMIAMPIAGFQRRLLGKRDVHGAIARGAPGSGTSRLKSAIEAVLRERRATGGGEDDFSVVELRQAAEAAASTSTTMTALLKVLAVVSLAVGAIGIANVMLVSVAERTHEIGIRLAIGATPRQIRHQFLAEAMLLATAGGAIGILAGLIGSAIATAWLEVPWLPGLDSIAWAVVIAAGLGAACGFEPARRAARLDPIAALRQG